jgi:hypothetical protein
MATDGPTDGPTSRPESRRRSESINEPRRTVTKSSGFECVFNRHPLSYRSAITTLHCSVFDLPSVFSSGYKVTSLYLKSADLVQTTTAQPRS